jgi:hypothetical protein
MNNELGFQKLNIGYGPVFELENVVVVQNDGKALVEYGPFFREPWTKDGIAYILDDLRIEKPYYDPLLHWHLLIETESGLHTYPLESTPNYANILASYGKVIRDILDKNNINGNILKPEDISRECIGKRSLCFFDPNSTPQIIETISVKAVSSDEKNIKLFFPEQTIYDFGEKEYIQFGPSENDVIITKDKNNEYSVSWREL